MTYGLGRRGCGSGVALLVALTACGGEAGGPEPEPEPEPEPICEDPLAIERADGTCARPGVPVDGCALGFVHDGVDACVPTLPAEACPPGQMAVPGEASCRPVMECAGGPWGDVVGDVDTQWVDGAYLGGDSDGSQSRPWTTIGEGVAAVSDGGMVAIAEGSYAESVLVQDKGVVLRGACPDRVTVVGSAAPNGPCPPTTLCILGAETAGSEVTGLSLTGPGVGLGVVATDVTVDRVRVHGNPTAGIIVQHELDVPTAIAISGSLLEGNGTLGIFLNGAEGAIDGSVIRDTDGSPGAQIFGQGLAVLPRCELEPPADCGVVIARSIATVTGSLFEGNHHGGIHLEASDVTVEGTVVRRTQPQLSDAKFGRAVDAVDRCGEGIGGDSCTPEALNRLWIRGSVFEDNHEMGVYVSGGEATIENTVVRATAPSSADGRFGRGLNMQLPCGSGTTGTTCFDEATSELSLRQSTVAVSHEVGLLIAGAHASVDRVVVRETAARPMDGLFGDGVVAVSERGSASAVVVASLVEGSARSGVAAFGAAVGMGDSRVGCATLSLTSESYEDLDAAFDDLGGNRCGCAFDEACKAVSSGLAPPSSVAASP